MMRLGCLLLLLTFFAVLVSPSVRMAYDHFACAEWQEVQGYDKAYALFVPPVTWDVRERYYTYSVCKAYRW